MSDMKKSIIVSHYYYATENVENTSTSTSIIRLVLVRLESSLFGPELLSGRLFLFKILLWKSEYAVSSVI
jgi:hypothetical protein